MIQIILPFIKIAKTIFLLIVLLIFGFGTTNASVTILRASGGTSIPADNASNSPVPVYKTLGNVRLTEGVASDFSVGTNVTFILNAPTGWTFNTAAAITATYTAARDITQAIILSKTTTAITIQLSVSGTINIDVLTIAGIQVRANDGANVTGAGNITKSGTTVIAGCATGANLGTLSQKAGVVNRLILSLPGQTYTDAVTMAGSGNTGTATNQTAGTSFTISKITAIDQFYNVATTYTGIKTLTYSGPTNGLTTPTYTTSVSFTSGKSTTGLITTLKKAETSNITVTDGTVIGIISSGILVNPGVVSKFLVESAAGGSIGSQIAGTALSIKTTALDAENNICNSGPNVYTGTVTLTSSGILSSGGGITGPLVAGVLTSQSVTISNTGNFTITATRTTGGAQTGTSNSFTVDPGVVNNFLMVDVGGGNIGTHIAGLTFNIKITARDANNNACTSGVNAFTGTVNITSTGTMTSGSGTSAAFTAGVLSPKPIIISNLGNFTITATKTSGSETGTSNTFQVTNIAIAPECVLTGGSSFTLAVNGSNFNSSCLVRINGVNRVTTFISATQLQANILASDIISTGINLIDVQNPLPGGGITSTADLIVSIPPVINTQPVSQSICAGSLASFNISSTGLGMSYQWMKNGIALINGGNISGATTSTLSINPISISDTSSSYKVKITTYCHAIVYSSTVELTLLQNTFNTANISICNGQSYTPPGGTAQTAAGTYFSLIPNAAGCDSTITTNLSVIPNTSSTADISICSGQSYTPPGGTAQTTTGTYITLIPNADGCDSTITTNLTVIPNTASTANISICDGQNYTPPGGSSETTSGTYITTITNATGCDSIITTNLTVIPNTSSTANISICDGQSYTPPGGIAQTTSGTYITHVTNAAGCDSAITTILTIIPNTSSTANISICDGQSYTPPGGSTQSTAGTYVTVIPNTAGCDSTITTNLSVIPNSSSTANISICDGQSYTPPGGSALTTSGTYVTVIPNAAGCDSTITTNLSLIPNTSSTANISICNGSSYTPPGGSAQSTAGTYVTVIPNAAGCDSTITTNLTVNPHTTETANISICNGQSYTPPGGSAQSTAGTYVTVIPNAAGCDSTITTNLSLIPNSSSTANISICDGQSYTPPGGSALTTSGTYVTVIPNVAGCDSTITTNLTVNPHTAETANISICNGQSYTPPGGSSETTSGTYITTITNAAGCDSTITTNLSVIPNTSSTANISICDGQSYTPPGGSAQSSAGTYVTVIANAAGCDSTITTNLSLISNTSSTANISICNGQSYTPPGGTAQTAAGTFDTYITNTAGCDSAITTNLTVIPNTSSTANISICDGQNYTPPGGTAQTTSGTYITHITNGAGCDSAITTNLTVIPNTSSIANVTICAGTSYTPPGGSAETNSGTYITHITNAAGCDSAITTNLLVITASSTSQNIEICKGGSTTLPDMTIVSPIVNTDYTTTFSSINVPGCDSVITTHVIVNQLPVLTATVSQIQCSGNTGSVSLSASNGTPSYTFSGSPTINLSAGTYNYNVTDSKGCIGTTSASINPGPSALLFTSTTSQIICFGYKGSVSLSVSGGVSPYVFSGSNTTNLTSGTFNYTVTDSIGCSKNLSATINPSPPQLVHTATATQIACYLGKGSVALSTSGGTPEYILSGSPKTNLSPGTYNYTVTDSKGCIATAFAFIAPAPARLTGIASSTTTRCDGNTGTISISVSGGSAPYSFLWNTSPVQSTPLITGLSVGSYTVTITDGHGCTTTVQKSVASALPTTITITGKSNVCPNSPTTLCASTNFVSYLWNTGETTRCISATAGGTYTVNGINAYGCSSIANKILTNSTAPIPLITGNNYLCPGSSTILCASPGFSSYTWNNGLKAQCRTITAGGIYSVTVTNASGCTASVSQTVKTPLSLTSSVIHGVCSNGFLGSVSVTPSGDTGPYTYLWNNGATTQSISELGAGTYIVTVTDSYGCTATKSLTVAINKLTSDYSTINSSFNGTTISANTYIWFSSVVNVNYTGNYPVTIRFTNQTLQSSKFNLTPFNGKLILTNSVTQASTIFDGAEWITTAPPNLSGEYFISGYSYPVTLAITPNLNPVTWKGIWASSCPGVNSIAWKWSAAVYSTFTTSLDSIGVKPVDDNSASTYNNNNLAGSPENYTANLIIGARSTGGTNYTGSHSGIGIRTPCAPVNCAVNNSPHSSRIKLEKLSNKEEIDFHYNSFPNPFTSIVTIELGRNDKSCKTTIEIFNVAGQKVASIFDEVIEQGLKYSVDYNAEELIDGIYICKIISGEKVINNKLILRK